MVPRNSSTATEIRAVVCKRFLEDGRGFKAGKGGGAQEEVLLFLLRHTVSLPIILCVVPLFVDTASARTHEARPGTLVEVLARSVYSGARDRRSKVFYFRREWIRRFPWFRCERHYFVRTYRYIVVCFLHTRNTTDKSQVPSFQR